MRGTHPTKTNLAGTRMKSLNNLITLFQSSKKQSNSVYKENLMIENEVEGIELLQTMQWSKLCWDASWEEVIELNDLLPKVGQKYPIKLEDNEYYAQEGKAYFLWLPPHSEFNGWYDTRPSEILKSYVLEGTLSNPSSNYESREWFFDFEVKSRTRLVECFNRLNEMHASYKPHFSKYQGNLEYSWKDVHDLQKFELEGYLYLSGVEYEVYSELILSYENNRLCMHYSAVLPISSNYETVITKYYLNEKEQKLFEGLIKKATEIIDTSAELLTDNQIHGAEY